MCMETRIFMNYVVPILNNRKRMDQDYMLAAATVLATIMFYLPRNT